MYMEKKRFTALTLFPAVVIMSACLLTACFGRQVLFSCHYDNVAGINSIDFRNGVITFYFDKEKASSGEMKSLFEDTEKNIKVSFSGKYGAEDFGPDNIKTDRERMTLEVSTGYNTDRYISSIMVFCNNDRLSLDLKDATLKTWVIVSREGEVGPLRGTVTTTYRTTTQSYDKKSRAWSEPVQETFDFSIVQ